MQADGLRTSASVGHEKSREKEAKNAKEAELEAERADEENEARELEEEYLRQMQQAASGSCFAIPKS